LSTPIVERRTFVPLGLSFRQLGLVPIIFADALDQQKLAVGFQLVRNSIRGAWQNFETLADGKRVALVWPLGFDRQKYPAAQSSGRCSGRESARE
jgi:hypothetical protein